MNKDDKPPHDAPLPARTLNKIVSMHGFVKHLITLANFLVFFGIVIFLYMLCLRLDGWLGITGIVPRRVGHIIGAPFLAIGFWLTGWCVWRFLRAHGTPVPAMPPRTLITNGPYRWCRNPMAGGALILLFGLGLALGSPCAVCIFVPGLALLLTAFIKYVEEPELVLRFGDDYRRYRTSVLMFFPWLSRK